MILKNGIFILALWTLLLGPTLCGLGVLVHACLGASADDCHAEVQCSTDPCQILVIPTAAVDGKTGDGFDVDQVVTPAFAETADPELPTVPAMPGSVLLVNLAHAPASGQSLPLLC